jgi:hypothetical protein
MYIETPEIPAKTVEALFFAKYLRGERYVFRRWSWIVANKD